MANFNDLEDQIQYSCLKWFRETYPHASGMLFHVPNGGLRTVKEAARLVAVGVVSGVPDLVGLTPDGKVFFIEMKTPTGSTSKAQKTWHEKAKDWGFPVYICRTLQEFKEVIEKYY